MSGNNSNWKLELEDGSDGEHGEDLFLDENKTSSENSSVSENISHSISRSRSNCSSSSSRSSKSNSRSKTEKRLFTLRKPIIKDEMKNKL